MDAGATTATGLRSAAAPRNQPLSIRATRAPDTERADEASMVEPVSPTGRLMDSFYIVVTIGLGTPVNVPACRAGVEAQLARHPRFCSIQQVTDGSEDGNPHWVPATVNLDDHIVIPGLDPAAVAADPDRAVEDYVASLSTLPMDRSRPLWEFHVLDFPTSEAASTVALRVHHSLGDGMALLTLLIACTRSAADPARLPAMPPPPAREGPIYARARPPASAGFRALAAWLWSYAVLAWHTVADVVAFVDRHGPVRDADTRKLICLRSVLLVNLRPPASLQVAATIFGRMIAHTTISFSNMVRPGEQVEFCGHPVAFLAPSVYGPPEALTVHYQSYNNTIKVILAVDEAHFACNDAIGIADSEVPAAVKYSG
ncbi:unnamed protein product [Urochloa decumbens]|uniref:Diacylglycerol O-acyltransferase n=1 Tax=Urochloa decumbens TaxID=240449 RepID=A0ABC9A7P9_9POAL